MDLPMFFLPEASNFVELLTVGVEGATAAQLSSSILGSLFFWGGGESFPEMGMGQH